MGWFYSPLGETACPLGTEAVQVELISLVGNVVFSDVQDTGVKGNSIEINTESIESGSYLVRITGSDSKNSTTTSISIK